MLQAINHKKTEVIKITQMKLPISILFALIATFTFQPSLSANNPTVAIITVTNTNDSGPGSLRDAVAQANSNGVPDLIEFNIAGGGTPQTINIGDRLQITESGTTIDGTTQGALVSLVASIPYNDDGIRIVTADNCSIIGLRLSSFYYGIYFDTCSNCSVSDCVIEDVEGYGIFIRSCNAGIIEGNLIGTDITGNFDTSPVGSGGLFMAISTNFTVQNNLISGFNEDPDSFGIQLVGFSNNNLIQNNIIGLNLSANAPIPNTKGIVMWEAENNQIINNFIGGNTVAGIDMAPQPGGG